MSDVTYINKDLLMEGSLESKDGQVVIAGHYKGNVIARSVIIEQSALFNGNINAEMAKNILLNNDIPSYIKSDFFGSAYNLNAFDIPTGTVKLYIPEGFKKKALDLLQGIGLQNE